MATGADMSADYSCQYSGSGAATMIERRGAFFFLSTPPRARKWNSVYN
jgi:hypothetical protein